MQYGRILLLFFTVCFMHMVSFSKEDIFKLGKLSKEEIELKFCPYDSTAGAVVIKDIGMVEFKFNNNNSRFEYTYTKKTRIKIFNSNQLEKANQQFFLYVGESDEESVSKIKGTTYNFENGKTIESELSKEAVFKDKYDDKHKVVKFTMPKVQVGSIIEFEYSINSNFIYSLPNWKFQNDIPVLKSNYFLEIPEFYTYRVNAKGYAYLNKKILDSRNVTEYISQRVSNFGGTTTNYSGNLEFSMNATNWEATNMPAITEEPYVACLDNYISQIDYEIASVRIPNSIEQNYTTTWKDVIAKLLIHEKVGGQLNKNTPYLTDLFQTISKSSLTKMEKLNAAYTAIQSKMSWDEIKSKYVNTNLKEAFKNSKGNCAEINFILLSLLKDLEIESYPVMLSTRNNGFTPSYPTEDGFNYIVALAKVDGKSILLDATLKNVLAGTLPRRCLNGKGLILNEKNVEWIDLISTTNQNTITSIDGKMDAFGKIKGKINVVKKGYAAIDLRDDISSEKENYLKELEKENPGLTVTSNNFQNIDSLNLPTKEIYEFTMDGVAEKNNDRIYFSPVIIDKLTENPFRLKNRIYPVEYPYPFELTYIANIELPEGFKVEEKPTDINMTLPENNGKFTYIINVLNEKAIQVNYKFSIKKTIFAGDEYELIREFYTQFIKKIDEQVVLKKI